ncbi:hypothetical protein DFH07DRAFT_975000 [Mycena maculata]|uniref:HpcH/HpaI aldolase/citrate lyase domain-containing protein n=1 Tax=Mycena maculata TaxID=230809 RepID=A0AAD7ME39_9AGAR|nr:hypothetical protein DFH07DRAFT_975000 [Mycena maculata]
MYMHAAGALSGTYKASTNTNFVIAVQIEHPNAVKEIDAICAEGINIVFIGPFDLATSMNVEFGGEEHEAAIIKILNRCEM